MTAVTDPRWRLACLAVAAAATVNVLLFAGQATIPLVQGDAWGSLLGWLGNALEGRLQPLDLLVQPTRDTTNLFFQKLLVLAHARWLDLDFAVEGIIAALSAIALGLMLVGRMAGFDLARWRARDWSAATALMLLATTLASTNVYTWGLAGLWFTWVAMGVAAYLWLDRPAARAWQGVLAGVVLGLAVDEMALVVLLPALLLTMALADPRGLRQRWPVPAGFAVGVLATQALYAWANAAAGLPDVDDVQGGWRLLASPGFVAAFATQPLLETLAPAGHRERLFGVAAGAVTVAVMAVAVLANLGFWARVAQRVRGGGLSPALALAVFLMLVSYAMVVGIGHQRLAQFGLDYLQQPRYLVFYVLQPLALVLTLHEGLPAFGRPGRALAAAAVLGLAVLQLGHAVHAWHHLKHLSVYLQGAARVFGELDRDPRAVPADCPDILSVCHMDEASRVLVLRRLREAGVNLHAEDFRARHRLSMAPLPPAAGPSP